MLYRAHCCEFPLDLPLPKQFCLKYAAIAAVYTGITSFMRYRKKTDFVVLLNCSIVLSLSLWPNNASIIRFLSRSARVVPAEVAAKFRFSQDMALTLAG